MFISSLIENITLKKRRILLMLLDLLATSVTFSYVVFDKYSVSYVWEHHYFILLALVAFVAIRLTLFSFMSLYVPLWRYASTRDIIHVVLSVTLSSVAMAAFSFLFFRFYLVTTIYITEWAFAIIAIGGIRGGLKLYRRYLLNKNKMPIKAVEKKRVLIVGAGDAGEMIVREIKRVSLLNYELVGFVDDRTEKLGNSIHNIKVLGTIRDIPQLAKQYDVEEAIIAIPSASGKVIRMIMDQCQEAGITYQTTPALFDIIDGNISVSQIRNVEIEDLLGRSVVEADVASLSQFLQNKRVLVTGAAGSIGSELCRQICRHSPQQLVMLDHSEPGMYDIDREMSRAACDRHVAIVADVRDRQRLAAIFTEHRPDIVFHAAAYKHVPLMEINPYEVVMNNIVGVQNMVDLAHDNKVSDFVLISTDKAVHPANVMGASKRVGELILETKSRESDTRYTAVRFGNVLGSRGSVVPLFKEQIANGGPITVTDPDMTRYFMTIPEAVTLVMLAGSLSNGAQLFVLDMGEPVKIMSLAEDLIRLSGLELGKDIEIVFTGARPGEKLAEELFYDKDHLDKTSHEKIFISRLSLIEVERVKSAIQQLIEVSKTGKAAEIRDALLQLTSTVGKEVESYS